MVRSGTWQTIRMARKAGNLSQWHCLTPPYRGRIECYPDELLRVERHPDDPDKPAEQE